MGSAWMATMLTVPHTRTTSVTSRTAAGLPVGVQVVGRPFEESRVLDAARVIEDALGGWLAPPEDPPNENA